MDLIGKSFKHKLYGVGVVSAQQKGILTIDFPEKATTRMTFSGFAM